MGQDAHSYLCGVALFQAIGKFAAGLLPVALLLFLSMGLVLGLPVSFAILLFCIPIIAVRIRNEEKVLEHGPEGCDEYRTRVKYKVIPFIW